MAHVRGCGWGEVFTELSQGVRWGGRSCLDEGTYMPAEA